jgi:chromosome segregation ATPase
MTFAAGILAICTSCREHKQLDSEISALKAQIQTLLGEESHTEDEMKKAVAGYAAISNSNIIRKSGMTLQQKREAAAAEISLLQKERDKLQTELDTINKAAAAYRQKYL